MQETLDAVPIFFIDSASGLNIMEEPDGRKFEIRWVPGAPRDCNYEVVRELVELPPEACRS